MKQYIELSEVEKLLKTLSDKDDELSGFYSLQSLTRQGFLEAKGIVNKWALSLKGKEVTIPASHPESPQPMKWVKAKERPIPTPAERSRVNIKYKDKPDLLVYWNGNWYWYDGDNKFPEDNIVHQDSWSAIEWLDESPQPDKDAEIKEALRVGVNIGMQNVEKPRFEGDYNFNQAKALKECDEYLKSLPDLRSHPTDREVWVEVSVKDELPPLGEMVSLSTDNGKTFSYEISYRGWLPPESKYTHWLKKVKLSTLLQDREQAEPKTIVSDNEKWHPQYYPKSDREQPAPDREKGNDEASGSALI
jgi:hypothetical protein